MKPSIIVFLALCLLISDSVSQPQRYYGIKISHINTKSES